MARTPLGASRLPRGPWGFAFAGAAVGLVLALVLFSPARWLAATSTATAGRVRLQDARGTVWNGSAQMLLTGGAGSTDAAPALAPGVAPAAGLHRPARGLTAECCIAAAAVRRGQPRLARRRVARGGRRVAVAGLAAHRPGHALEHARAGRHARAAHQRPRLRWTEGRLAVAGRAELTAEARGLAAVDAAPHGQLPRHAVRRRRSRLQLATIEGALQLSGSGQWVGDRLRFTGEATAAPERGAALANLLNIIGRPSGARSIISIG
jgi:general secretion pathway protein N